MSSFARPMKEISRKELYTNLEARVQYLHGFLDFLSRDIDALISGGKYIKQLIPAVVNIVYRKLLTYDITARAFTTRSTSYEGLIDEVVDEDSPQIRHRKTWEYLDKVGQVKMMHTGVGRVNPLHIEYIHIGVCLSFIQDVFTEAILSHPRISLHRKIAIVKALGKVIWIQNDLFAKWYVRDGEEFADEKEEVVVEQEGYLHGVRVLDSDIESQNGDETETAPVPKDGENGTKKPGLCPFTGVQANLEELKISPSPPSSPGSKIPVAKSP